MSQAPRGFVPTRFSSKEQVYYGTDDGSRDGSFGEFVAIRNHYENVSPNRKDDIHMVSVIGGLYGLNLIHLWKPKKITFFDINPAAINYFNIIRKVWISSDSAQHFLDRLTQGDYEVTSEVDAFLKENIQIVQKNGHIDEVRGAFSSHGRDLANSWRLALENFDETKKYLIESEIDTRTEPIEGENFKELISSKTQHWIYASNITQFHFFDLEILEPSNVVLLQIHHEDAQLLDLAEYADNAIRVKFEYPIRIETI